MVKVCVVSGCSNRQKKGGVSFFSIPGVIESQGAKTKELSSQRRTLWLARINRKNWSPSSSSRVCGDHFISGNTFIYYLAILIIIAVIYIGRPSVLYNELNPDWAPSLNMGYSIVSMDTQRYHRLQNRKRKIEEQESSKKRRCNDLPEQSVSALVTQQVGSTDITDEQNDSNDGQDSMLEQDNSIGDQVDSSMGQNDSNGEQDSVERNDSNGERDSVERNDSKGEQDSVEQNDSSGEQDSMEQSSNGGGSCCEDGERNGSDDSDESEKVEEIAQLQEENESLKRENGLLKKELETVKQECADAKRACEEYKRRYCRTTISIECLRKNIDAKLKFYTGMLQ